MNNMPPAELQELARMISTLGIDVDTSQNALAKENTPFWKRTYIRALFASFEALTHFLKQHARLRKSILTPLVPDGSVSIPVPALSLLMGESYSVDDQGNIKIREAKIPFLANTLFALTQAKEAFGSTRDIQKDTGWEAFRRAADIRDRITHPKQPQDIEITDAEIEVVNRAYAWFRRETTELIASIPGVTPEDMEELRRLA